MSDRIVSLMLEATASLQVEWEDPASLRRRADRRKAGRQAAVVLGSLAALGATGSLALGPAAQPPVIDPPPTPPPTCAYVKIPQPAPPPRLRVYHSAIGVATEIAEQLEDRGYQVEDAARTDESTGTAVAVIRHGPYNDAAAGFLREQLLADEVIMELDEDNTGTIDLILGPRFRQLLPQC